MPFRVVNGIVIDPALTVMSPLMLRTNITSLPLVEARG
jgi:hypothetical protein